MKRRARSVQDTHPIVLRTSREPDAATVELAEELIDGASVSAADPSKCNAVYLYLRSHKAAILKEHPPNYLRASRIDEVCAQLLLVSSKTSYCDFKCTAIERLQRKLGRARRRLQTAVDLLQKSADEYEKARALAVEQLREQHDHALREHDEQYQDELPVRYRHISGEVHQIRAQEKALKETERYSEAQLMMEEAEALERFELEKQWLQWQHDGMQQRELIIQRQAKQMVCFIDRIDEWWAVRLPEFNADIEHWQKVVAHLEEQVGREKGDLAEVARATRELLTRDDALPKLGTQMRQAPLHRVTTRNNQRTYTRHSTRRK
jgi:hypothetical protein